MPLLILGGMGPMAGVELHRQLVINSEASNDQEHESIIHISESESINDRTEYLLGRSSINPGKQASKLIKKYNDREYILGVPCNTFHSKSIWKEFVLDMNENIRVLNMVELVKDKVSKYNRVGLLSTSGTRHSGVYGNVVLIDNQERLDKVIYNIKCMSYGDESIKNELESMINELEADCIILGCTELSVVIKYKMYKDKYIINPLEILSKEMLKINRLQ